MLDKALKIEKENPKYIYMLTYTLAQQYYLNSTLIKFFLLVDQKDQFLKHVNDLIKVVEEKSWNDLLLRNLIFNHLKATRAAS